MADLLIRPFAPADQAAARDLILAGLEEHWGWLDLSLNPDLDDIATHYVCGDFLTGWLDGRLVATGALLPAEPGVGQVVRMSVAADLRRSGYGRRMLAALVTCARRRGLRRLVLETTATWHEVVAFYERNGFTSTFERDGDQYFERWLEEEPHV